MLNVGQWVHKIFSGLDEILDLKNNLRSTKRNV